MKITVIGTGYVGLVTGACLADAGHEVLCIDVDDRKIDALRRLEMPIYEEGLLDVVRCTMEAGRLHFSTSMQEGVAFAEVLFIAVGTPPGHRGQADLSSVEEVGRTVAGHMTAYRLLIEKSTVPVNTSTYLKRTVRKYLREDIPFDVASNPEFLREGCAVRDATHPDRIVVGVESDRAAALLRAVYQPLIDRSGCPFLVMNIASAELTKHACNSFLAMKISYINAVSRICELAGADISMVARGMGLDERIGPRFLGAGVGYGGSCFPKDVAAFVHLGDELGYDFRLLREVQRINQAQREHLLQQIEKELWVIQNKTVAILGLAFKPGTDDIREAPSLFFVDRLTEAGAVLRLWDPVARARFEAHVPGLDYYDDPLECLRGADLGLILTEWPVLRDLDLVAARSVMRSPVLVDGRNLYDPAVARAAGFTYVSVGRP